MVSLTRYWIFSTVCCSLCASSLQLYTDYGQDYDSVEASKADDQAAQPYYRNMLSQALKSSYYVPLDDTYASAAALSSAASSASEETENNLRLDDAPSKRSRYYRKYPGKRQNRRYNDVYECNPNSRETVRLLFAIHQARQGDIDNIVFCNRLRNPKTLIPNPRYIGKRSE